MSECLHIQNGRLMGVSNRFLWVSSGSSVGLAFQLCPFAFPWLRTPRMWDFTFNTLASSSSERLVWGSACWSRRSNSFGVRMAGAKNLRKRKPLMARYFTSCQEEQQVRGAPKDPLPDGETEAGRSIDWWCKGKRDGRWARRPYWSGKMAFSL